MIYRHKINSLTTISNILSNKNYGADQQLLFGKYKDQYKINHQNRILFKDNLNTILQKINLLIDDVDVADVDKIELKFFISNKVFYDNDINGNVFPITKHWDNGYGKYASKNNSEQYLSGASWLRSTNQILWNTAGSDFSDSQHATFTINKEDNSFVIDVTTLFKNNNLQYGYVIIPQNIQRGLIGIFSKTTNYDLSAPIALFYINDRIYQITELQQQILNTNKRFDAAIVNVKHVYNKKQIIRFKLNIRYNFQFKSWDVDYYNQPDIIIPQNAYYEIRQYKTNQIVIPGNSIYTAISYDAENGNYFDFDMNCLQTNHTYYIVIFLDSIELNMVFTFKVR